MMLDRLQPQMLIDEYYFMLLPRRGEPARAADDYDDACRWRRNVSQGAK